MLICVPLSARENLGMHFRPSPIPPIQNAADYIDALLRLPEDETYWLKKVVPGRRMRDTLIPRPGQREDRNSARPD